MMACFHSTKTKKYLPKELCAIEKNYENDLYHFDHAEQLISCKLLTTNPYRPHLRQVYPTTINEHCLTDDMLNVLKTYTDSKNNECCLKTNLNLLTNNDIDWSYTNKLHSLIRGLQQHDIKPIYYRGLYLSDIEIKYYQDRINQHYYTQSFSSFTIDRILVYSGNAIIILRTTPENKSSIANVWKWSTIPDEKEAILSIGSKLKICSVHYFGYKWEIEVELIDEELDDDDKSHSDDDY
ncbi:unnamed protein product [Didymodactylos carnosus]|uniref:Uncharacterized protein n=1 Tax=Didymodactylos carnosus TaxID=1234261 RepID=A0A814PBI0_9BILA|nr:unnamed protein product [Didymodactylos carnosus]CAF1290277.1 unnamed protein product [Didymodactylos carnosus]CAF3870089.1 unnamed protein product [Didymodactylos carnosus]CAF4095135.1 unnamed protein product [Didymodactylos carnosus]